MNKIFQILSVLVFAFGVVGCGSGGKTPASLIVNSNTDNIDRIIESTTGATYTFTLRNPPKSGDKAVDVEVSLVPIGDDVNTSARISLSTFTFTTSNTPIALKINSSNKEVVVYFKIDGDADAKNENFEIRYKIGINGTDAPNSTIRFEVLDNNSNGITIDPVPPIKDKVPIRVPIKVGGNTHTFKLKSQPTKTVTITFTSSMPDVVLVSPATMNFTAMGTSWKIPQTLTITLTDTITIGSVASTKTSSVDVSINYTLSSEDAEYNNNFGGSIIFSATKTAIVKVAQLQQITEANTPTYYDFTPTPTLILKGKNTIPLNGKIDLEAQLKTSSGKPYDASTIESKSWSSSIDQTAEVDDFGIVTATTLGNAIITLRGVIKGDDLHLTKTIHIKSP